VVTRQLLVERSTAKARRSKTNVLPLSHGTCCVAFQMWRFIILDSRNCQFIHSFERY